MEAILINGMTKDDFLSCIREIVREEILLTNKNSVTSDEFISVKELQKLFRPSVSRVTVDSWCAKGLLNKHYVGGMVFFSRKEVQESLTRIKKYKPYPAEGNRNVQITN